MSDTNSEELETARSLLLLSHDTDDENERESIAAGSEHHANRPVENETPRAGVRIPSVNAPPAPTPVRIAAPQANERPVPIAGELALQAYLLRQQMLAGIPRENLIPMRPQHARGGTPAVVQITNNGINIPRIPPARFNGVLHPLPQMLRANPRGGAANATQANAVNDRVRAQPRPETARTPPTPNPTGVRAATVQIPIVNNNAPRHIDALENLRGAMRTRDLENPPAQGNARATNANGTPGQRAYPPNLRLVAAPIRPQVRDEDEYERDDNYVYPHNGFDLLNAFVQHRELAIMLTEYLGTPDLINLFSVTKPFHYFMQAYLPQIIDRQLARKRPQSAQVFPFRCYPKVCIRIVRYPAIGEPNANANNLTQGVVDRTPTLGYLCMTLSRDIIVKQIMKIMESSGLGLPDNCDIALKKLWFFMDISDNKRREWTVQNRNLWTDLDLFYICIFFVRLDTFLRRQRGQDENVNGGNLRYLILAQPSLAFLWRVLRKKELKTKIDVIFTFTRTHYIPPPGEEQLTVFGVEPIKIGALQWEKYGRGCRYLGAGRMVEREKLVRPDQFIVDEVTRRELDLAHMYTEVFMNVDMSQYAQCERPNATWDQEMRNAVQGSERKWLDSIRLD